MFAWAKYQYTMGRLNRERRNNEAEFSKRIAEAKKQKADRDAQEIIYGEWSDARTETEGKIAFAASQYWRELADRHVIPVPDFDVNDGKWQRNPMTGLWSLSVAEIAKLRSTVRQEQKESRERWQVVLSLLIGLGGILVAMLSLALKAN